MYRPKLALRNRHFSIRILCRRARKPTDGLEAAALGALTPKYSPGDWCNTRDGPRFTSPLHGLPAPLIWLAHLLHPRSVPRHTPPPLINAFRLPWGPALTPRTGYSSARYHRFYIVPICVTDDFQQLFYYVRLRSFLLGRTTYLLTYLLKLLSCGLGGWGFWYAGR